MFNINHTLRTIKSLVISTVFHFLLFNHKSAKMVKICALLKVSSILSMVSLIHAVGAWSYFAYCA